MTNLKFPLTLTWLNKYGVFIARLLVAGIFILAALPKVFAPIQEFISVARLWNVIPEPWVTIYAVALPAVELVAGVMLLVGFKHRWASSLIGLMLISFLIGIGMNLARGTELDNCGCFGSWFSLGDTFKDLWWRDWFFLFATAWIALVKPPLWLSVDKWLAK